MQRKGKVKVMFTRENAKLEAGRLLASLKAAGRTRMGFIDLLDDKGYVPAEPKVETPLEKAAITVLASMFSVANDVREGYDWLTEPEFDFMDLLASKGQVPALAGAEVPMRKGANDNWPVADVIGGKLDGDGVAA